MTTRASGRASSSKKRARTTPSAIAAHTYAECCTIAYVYEREGNGDNFPGIQSLDSTTKTLAMFLYLSQISTDVFFRGNHYNALRRYLMSNPGGPDAITDLDSVNVDDETSWYKMFIELANFQWFNLLVPLKAQKLPGGNMTRMYLTLCVQDTPFETFLVSLMGRVFLGGTFSSVSMQERCQRLEVWTTTLARSHTSVKGDIHDAMRNSTRTLATCSPKDPCAVCTRDNGPPPLLEAMRQWHASTTAQNSRRFTYFSVKCIGGFH